MLPIVGENGRNISIISGLTSECKLGLKAYFHNALPLNLKQLRCGACVRRPVYLSFMSVAVMAKNQLNRGKGYCPCTSQAAVMVVGKSGQESEAAGHMLS